MWLLWQIVLANIQVFKLAFHPNILEVLSPRLISFKTSLKGEVPQFILAQSITLTPGTVAVGIDNGEFKVHAINHEGSNCSARRHGGSHLCHLQRTRYCLIYF